MTHDESGMSKRVPFFFILTFLMTTFEALGIIPELVESCKLLKYTQPTDIQTQSIPLALAGRDIIGLAQTGSGKTAAFALPVLQQLFQSPQPFFVCVMAPTRELAVQIGEQFEALGSTIGVKVSVLVGGMDMMAQQISLSRRPHVIVCTPGRLVDHLENTKGFSLGNLKYLVSPRISYINCKCIRPLVSCANQFKEKK